jgi:hypothetical protein
MPPSRMVRRDDLADADLPREIGTGAEIVL